MSEKLTLIRDCDYILPVTIDVGGTAVDLTGKTVKFQVTKSANDPVDRAEFTVTQTSHTSPTTGETTITIPRAELDTAGKFVYRLWIVDGSGNVSKTLYGELQVDY